MEKSNEMLMKPFSKALSELNNPYIKDSRSNGNKVIGLFCSYIPPELFAAGGMIPFRVKGKPGRDIGSGTTYLSTRLCTFSRNALTLVLENDYSFLDGFVGCNTCDQIRRASQNWIVKKPANFTRFIHIPRVYGRENIVFFKDQLIELKQELETWSGKKISDDDLRAASLKYNRAREILRKLSMLRTYNKPALSGSEMLAISVAYHQMPVDDFIPAGESLLENLLKEKPSDKGSSGKARLLLCGGMIDEPEYIAFVEEQGIDIVADAVCFGMRSYWDDVDTTKDPMEAIAERALTHFPCPHIG
jgi:benzoyl-CoA reductase subunit C